MKRICFLFLLSCGGTNTVCSGDSENPDLSAPEAGDLATLDLATFDLATFDLANEAALPNPPAGMVLIPAGKFTMGDSIDGASDAPVNSVYVSAFFFDINLVSYGEWQTTYAWATSHGYTFDTPGSANGATAGATGDIHYPAQSLSWFDAARWCNARSENEGLAPVYFSDSAFTSIFKTGHGVPFANWSAGGYRLPTEAEWEKAARGGHEMRRFPWGNFISTANANYYGDPFGGADGYTYDHAPGGPNAMWYVNTGFSQEIGDTSPVGAFPPNDFGLYDMAGNVFEWCWDWYGDYSTPPISDPRGAPSGTNRVMRGGSWLHTAFNARAAYRGYTIPMFVDSSVGFRTARNAP